MKQGKIDLFRIVMHSANVMHKVKYVSFIHSQTTFVLNLNLLKIKII